MADIPLAVGALVFGGLTVLSYWYVFKGDNYIHSKHWYGIDPATVYAVLVFQALAACGFVGMVSAWCATPPRGGVFDHETRPWALATCVSGMLLFSTMWTLSLRTPSWWPLTVASLVVVSLCAIMLVAAAFEETHPRVFVVVCSILFATVTVLCDAVGWNARFIAYR
jgi:hypothetical protein